MDPVHNLWRLGESKAYALSREAYTACVSSGLGS